MTSQIELTAASPPLFRSGSAGLALMVIGRR
jgi:hypothetical protein